MPPLSDLIAAPEAVAGSPVDTLAGGIADRLRRDILTGALAPGASIKERDTAVELGVSRTPLREAVRILAQEGLVTLRPARSPIVAAPSLKEARDNLTVLIALEDLSARLACAAATGQDLTLLDRIHARLGAIYDIADPVDLFEIDMAFHRAIAAAAHNPPLLDTHARFLARLWRVRYLSASKRRNRGRVIAEHGEILDGLHRRDAAATATAVAAHLHNLIVHLPEVFAHEQMT